MTEEKKVEMYSIKRNETGFQRVRVNNSQKSADFIRQFYGDDLEVYESFFILLLDTSNHTIGYAKISQGGIMGTVVDTKIVAKYAVDTLATGIILAHNHPSGTRKPSTQDITLTRKLQQALKLLDTKILDHIILTKDSYYSFSDEGDI